VEKRWDVITIFRSRSDGLTLSEIIVALGLTAILSLIVLGVFTKLLLSSTKSTDLTTASLLARGVLEKVVREGPVGTAGTVRFPELEGETELFTQDRGSKTKFFYQVSSARLTTEADSGIGTLHNVRVTVSWWEDDGAESSRADYGKLSTQVERTVYVRR
jgi:hypothetical protein